MKDMQKLARYLDLYEKNNHSLVFAPLADLYRELGMLAEAKLVLKRGIEKYPDYLLGHIVASKCFFDQDEFYQAYLQLRDKKNIAVDNLMYWKEFSKVCQELNFHEENLEALKMVQSILPKKSLQIKEKISRIENLLKRNLKMSVERTETPVEDWEYLGFKEQRKNEVTLDHWEMN